MHTASFPHRFLACLAFLFLGAALFAQEEPEPIRVALHLTGNYHGEIRDTIGYVDGFDVLAGVDFLLWEEAGLYFGPRLGLYEETVCTAYMSGSLGRYLKPSFGGQAYFLIPSWFSAAISETLGVACDVLVNLDELHSDPGERLYLFVSAFLGTRLLIAANVFFEARFEAGLFPFFESPPFFLKAGLQLGMRL